MFEVKDKMKQIEMEDVNINNNIVATVILATVIMLSTIILVYGEATKRQVKMKQPVDISELDKPWNKWYEGEGR